MGIVLLSIHFVFSIVCGVLVLRVYGRRPSYFFKGFLRTFIFGFVGALYYLKNLQPDEQRELQIASWVTLVIVMFVRFVPSLEPLRVEFLLVVTALAAVAHGFASWKKSPNVRWYDCIGLVDDTYMLCLVSVGLAVMVLFVFLKAPLALMP